MALYRKLSLMAAKAEDPAHPGVAVALTAADAVDRISNLKFEFLTTKTKFERPGSMGKLSGIRGVRTARIQFRIGLSAESASPRVAAIYLAACAMGNAGDGVFSRVQNGLPNVPSTTIATLTMAFQLQGTMRTMYGAMGTAVIHKVAGEPTWIDFDFKGKYIAGVAVTTVTSVALAESVYTVNVASGTAIANGAKVWARDAAGNAIGGIVATGGGTGALVLSPAGLAILGTPASITAGSTLWSGGGIVDAALFAPTFNNVPLLRFANSGLAFGTAPNTYAPRVSKMDLDLGNKIEFLENVNAADGSGIDFAYVDDFDTIATFDPEQTLVSQNDFYSQWEAGAEQAAAWSVTAGGASAAFSMSKAEYVNLKDGTRRGLATWEMGFQDNNADLSITFTPA